ncbi:hypothetical protein P255_02987 [Acinetobacter brisouii CIP 110357]|uniref:Uncharacterized protein n=1 Tax=Acinetobacter brisouii CIP 110357 TaxID=1341683 RepID=V2UFR7_9GAMM|nr:hypothetical protein [Acinetobacter brisouii]ENV46180.1 hypothetical protein F954_02815 [Acinetobacter brisouii ANC 4119]ESK47505.1 hypothetical protein P255_02987 [Acinetobacter brisouii CIP 110357]
MEQQKTKLDFSYYKRIDGYFQNHCQELISANKSVYDSVDSFREKFTHFEFSLSELTEDDKNKAWVHLYNKAKRVIKNNEDELNKKLALEKPLKKEKFKLNFIHVLFITIIIAFCVSFGIYNSRNSGQQDNAASQKQRTCINNGIEYYKSIGAYPRLTSENISASDKAKQLCSNSVNAFGVVN